MKKKISKLDQRIEKVLTQWGTPFRSLSVESKANWENLVRLIIKECVRYPPTTKSLICDVGELTNTVRLLRRKLEKRDLIIKAIQAALSDIRGLPK